MKRAIVKDLKGSINYISAEMEDPTGWVLENEAEHAWGLPGTYKVEILDVTLEVETRQKGLAELIKLKALLKSYVSNTDLKAKDMNQVLGALLQMLNYYKLLD